MKKLLLSSMLTLLFLAVAFLAGGKTEQVCAHDFGPGDTCPLDGSSVGSHYPSGTHSVDIPAWVTINGTVPPNTTAYVQIGIEAGDQSCGGELKCLKRSDETSFQLTQGAITYGPKTMINVGCSSSGCRNSSGQDLIQVSAYLYPQPPASAGCTAAIISSDNGWVTGTTGNYFLDITNANGASRPVYVSFTCTPTPTYTCGGGAPNYSNTTEQCQQQPTVTGCLDGWEKSKTNNTCPPPATCCSPIACTAPTAPAPSLVCSL